MRLNIETYRLSGDLIRDIDDDVEIEKFLSFQYQYYMDIGSIVHPVDDYDICVSKILEIIDWHKGHTKGGWYWIITNDNIHNGQKTLIAVRTRLRISFDLPDDAMLSRMTWFDLKGNKNVHS